MSAPAVIETADVVRAPGVSVDTAAGARVLTGIAAFGAIAAWLHLTGAAGIAEATVRQFIAAAVLAALAGVTLLGERDQRTAGLLGLLLAYVTYAAHPSTAALTFAVGIVLVLPHWLGANVLLAAALLNLAAEFVPALGVPLQSLANLFARFTTDSQLLAGPTPLAIVPYVLALSCIAYAAISARRYVLLGLGIAAVTAVEFWHLQTFHAGLDRSASSGLDAFAQLPTSVLLLSAAAAIFSAAAVRGEAVPAVKYPRNRLLQCMAGGAFIAIVMSLPLFGTPKGPTRVLVLNEGGLDWERPVVGKYDAYSWGMFGLFPVYASADDFTFNVLKTDQVTAANLAEADIFVLINTSKKWTAEERTVVRDFMERGKSVLVLGDHTDVFGLMKGFNTLLEEYGIKFRFDSAYHAEGSWAGCINEHRHPAVIQPRNGFKSSHAIGASLECSSRVLPLIRSPYSFSDDGIADNVMGAYLGDYQYKPGERLGDLELAVWRDVGAGKLLVYGDTSAYQNGGYHDNYAQHVLPVLRWLGRPCNVAERALSRWILGLLLFAVAIGVLIRTQNSALLMPGVLALCVTAYCAEAASRFLAPPPRTTPDTVLVDAGKFPWEGHYNAHMNVISPLYGNLLRTGLKPIEAASWTLTDLQAARGIVFVAPMRRFTSSEVNTLLEYQSGGGIVMLVVGGEQKAASMPLFEALGIDLAPTPLGTVPKQEEVRANDMVPRFHDAWPIVEWPYQPGKPAADWEAKGAKVLFKTDTHVAGLFLPRGKGGAIVLADSRYLSSQNVDGMWGHWPGNEKFLYSLCVEFFKGDPKSVKDMFVSPEKPK